MSDTELASLSVAKGGLEVVETNGRRRSWSAEEKDRIVGETLSGKESVGAVARRHGLTAQQLYGWRRSRCRSLTAWSSLQWWWRGRRSRSIFVG